MGLEVRVTGPAKNDIWSNYRWWGDNRSPEQAVRWFLQIDAIIPTLSDSAERHPHATEPALRAMGVRQVAFGLGRRPTHRILYGITDNVVVVYRVRSLKQDAIGPPDLESRT